MGESCVSAPDPGRSGCDRAGHDAHNDDASRGVALHAVEGAVIRRNAGRRSCPAPSRRVAVLADDGKVQVCAAIRRAPVVVIVEVDQHITIHVPKPSWNAGTSGIHPPIICEQLAQSGAFCWVVRRRAHKELAAWFRFRRPGTQFRCAAREGASRFEVCILERRLSSLAPVGGGVWVHRCCP